MRALKDKSRPAGVGQGSKVWIVDMRINEFTWVPTVGVALTRIDGERVLKEWRTKNPNDIFRLRKYWREGGIP